MQSSTPNLASRPAIRLPEYSGASFKCSPPYSVVSQRMQISTPESRFFHRQALHIAHQQRCRSGEAARHPWPHLLRPL